MKLKPHGILIAVLVVLVATVGASAADASTRKIALGVSYFNPSGQTNGGYADMSLAEAYKTHTGRYPAIWQVWSTWGDPASGPFPTALMSQIHVKQMTPIVTWQPTDNQSTNCLQWSLAKILDGSHNTYIDGWAAAAKAYRGTILLRFAHEMQGDWFIWGLGRCGNTSAQYRAAWRYVWSRFQAAGATNVKFVWNPINATKLKAFYPGDTYVDYAGVTAFNWAGAQNRPWRTMLQAFSPTMNGLVNAGIKKPVIGVEVGSAKDMTGCSTCIKADWITTGYPAVYTKWPKIKAIVYFDINMLPLTQNTQPDWRLVTPAGTASNPYPALVAYENIAKMAKFQGTMP